MSHGAAKGGEGMSEEVEVSRTLFLRSPHPQGGYLRALCLFALGSEGVRLAQSCSGLRAVRIARRRLVGREQ